MNQHKVETTVLSGTRYDLDDEREESIWVYPGIAYRLIRLGGDNPYYTSLSPDGVEDIDRTDGIPVEKTHYVSDGTVYVHHEDDVAIGVTDFAYEDRVYSVEEEFTANGTEYVRLRNGWSDVEDEFVRRDEFDQRCAEEDILRLWPVWTSAHR